MTIALVAASIIAAFVVLSALFLIEKKHAIEKRVELLTANFVEVIDEQVSASIDKVDLLLLDLGDQLEAQLAKDGRVDTTTTEASMARMLARVPEVDGLRVVDASGIITAIVGLQDKVGVSLADRDFFRAHKASSGNELIVSKPLVGRSVDRWIVTLSRKYLNPDGSFAGVIVAPIPVAHFTQLLSRLDLGPGGVAVIRDRELAMVTRYPPAAGTPGAIGIKSASPDFVSLFSSGLQQSTFHTPNPADGVERINSYRLLKRAPYVVLAGMATDYYLADWRNDVRKSIALVAVFAVIIALSGMLFWWIKRQQAREGALATTVLENAAEGIMVGGADGRIISVNRAFTDITGYTAEEASGQGLSLLKAPENGEGFGRRVREELAAKGRWQGQVWKRRKNGETFLALETISPVRDDHGGVAAHVLVFTDITELHRKDERIRHLAYHDPLTGLANRVLLQQRVEQAFERVTVEGEPFALLLVDLNRFKLVNDMLGHRAGDELLRRVSERLRECTDREDTIARVGGDEFVILQLQARERIDSERLATNVLNVLCKPYDIDGTPVTIGASIGIATAPADAMNFDELFGHADLALYRAKSEGRSYFRFYDPDMGKAAIDRAKLELDLRAAFEKDEFELHYQPCVNVTNGEIVACEALVRWHHPLRGMIPPAQFIPIAEDIGLIGRLGDWVLRRACEQAMMWPEEVKVAVNLSAAQFIGGQLYDTVQAALAAAGLPAERLELEITESLLIDDYEGAQQTLRRLRDSGIGVALDDFGTGYSSLTYLRQFPFDRIKIDKGFVAEITTRPDCAAIVSAVAGLGRSLDISITAEGIETREQLAMVRSAGCTHAQGFLFGRPVPASEILGILSPAGALQTG
jgi:diguanylate cyclase (GGDEF)-like protein/PAS domain S-box-containing protein